MQLDHLELRIFGSKLEIPTTQYTINPSGRLGDKSRLTRLAIWASSITRIFLAMIKKEKTGSNNKKNVKKAAYLTQEPSMKSMLATQQKNRSSILSPVSQKKG